MSLEYVHNYWPTLCFLVLLAVTFILKRVPLQVVSFDNHGYLLMFCAGLAGILALFSEHYWSSLIINIFLYMWVCTACLKIDCQSDPSAGGVSIFYGFIMMMGAGVSVMGKIVYVVFFD